jgi:hypothetical protein
MTNMCISDLNTTPKAKINDCLEALSLQEQSQVSGGWELAITSNQNGGTGVGIGFTLGGTAYGIGFGMAGMSSGGSYFAVATTSSPVDE